MEKQIASYLFQHKTCPLPGLGTLSITGAGSVADFTNKTFAAPKPMICFEQEETDAEGLLNYLSARNGADTYEATQALHHFCDGLKQKIHDQKDVELNNIGIFFADAPGTVNFTAQMLQPAFLQPVFAERVIHPDAEHQLLVGDKETTNTVMTGLLAPGPAIKDRWWIWAILLGLTGLLALVIYFTAFNGAYPFGNVIKN